jgi:hypothetical protein
MSMSAEQRVKAEWTWRVVMGTIGFVTMLTVGVIGWFLREAAIKQDKFNNDIEKRVRDVETLQSQSAASRFSVSDWINAKALLDERDATLDKRLTRQEDAMMVIKDELSKLNQKMDRVLNKP